MKYTRKYNVLTPIQQHRLTKFEKLIIWMAVVAITPLILFMFATEPSEWTNIMLSLSAI